MNVDTGEIRRYLAGEELDDGFVPVPKELEDEANALLGDNDRAHVDLSEDSGLSKFAQQKRAANKRNQKNIMRRKLAKKSRRIGRKR